MFPRTIRISAFNHNAHRFQRALKALRETGVEPLDAFAKLKKQQQNSTTAFSKAALAFIVVAVVSLVGSKGGSIDIKTAVFAFSIPEVYALFGASWLWFSFVLRLQGLAQLLAYTQAFKKHFGNFRHDYEMQVFIKDVEIDDYIAPPMFDRFLSPKKWTYFTRIALFAISFIAAVVPALGAWWMLLKRSIVTLWTGSDVPIGEVIAGANVALLVFPTAFILLGFVKTSPIRQIGFVRWTFLYPLMKDEYGGHPQASAWQSKEKQDK